MDAFFDPYYEWLGIPPEERPITPYRLLGLADFEDNQTIIDRAADRQMGYLRGFQTGPHAAACQQLLNELARARIELLDPRTKAEHDAGIRRRHAATVPQAAIPQSAIPVGVAMPPPPAYQPQPPSPVYQPEPLQPAIHPPFPPPAYEPEPPPEFEPEPLPYAFQPQPFPLPYGAQALVEAPQPVPVIRTTVFPSEVLSISSLPAPTAAARSPDPITRQELLKSLPELFAENRSLFIGGAIAAVLLIVIVPLLVMTLQSGGEGTIRFAADPDLWRGVTLTIDGQPVVPSEWPIGLWRPAGEHQLAASKFGFEWTAQILLRRGDVQEVTPTWQPKSTLVLDWPARQRQLCGVHINNNADLLNQQTFYSNQDVIKLALDPGKYDFWVFAVDGGWGTPGTVDLADGATATATVKAIIEEAEKNLGFESDPAKVFPPGVELPPDVDRPHHGCGLIAEVFDDAHFGHKVATRVDPRIDFVWGQLHSQERRPPFSIRWSGFINSRFQPYSTQLVAFAGGSIRVMVDGRVVLESNSQAAKRTEAPLDLVPEPHHFVVEYANDGADPIISLRLPPPSEVPHQLPFGTPFLNLYFNRTAARNGESPDLELALFPILNGYLPGLRQEVFSNSDFQSPPQQVSVCRSVDHLWTVHPNQSEPFPKEFSVRWSGMLHAPLAGTYKLAGISDDSMRVWLGDELVLDGWTRNSLMRVETERHLEAREYPIKVEYLKRGGTAICSLRWTLPGKSDELPIYAFGCRPAVVSPTSQEEPQAWRYMTDKPVDGWELPEFDDSNWKEGPGGFGTEETPGSIVRTRWNSSNIWLRRKIELPAAPTGNLQLLIHHDDEAEVYLNGMLLARRSGWTTEYEYVPLEIDPATLAKAVQPGANVLAVHCRQTDGGQYIDVGLVTASLASDGSPESSPPLREEPSRTEPPKPSPPPANPFEGFNKSVSLPGLETGESPSLRWPLGPCKVAEHALVVAHLLGGEFAAPEGRQKFDLVAANDGTARQAWDVRAMGGPQPIVIANFCVKEGALMFQWTPDGAKDPLAPYLANCALRLSAGAGQHVVALREPVVAPPLGIEVERQAQAKWPVENLPDPKSIHFEITKLDGIPRQRYEPENVIRGAGEEMTIWTGPDDEAMFLGLKIDSAIVGKNLQITSQPWIKFEGMEKAEKYSKKTLAKFKLDAAPALNRLTQQANALGNAKDEASVARKAVFTAHIEALTKRTAQVDELTTFAEAIQGGGAIHFRVYYVAEDDTQVDLLVTEGAPPADEKSGPAVPDTSWLFRAASDLPWQETISRGFIASAMLHPPCAVR